MKLLSTLLGVGLSAVLLCAQSVEPQNTVIESEQFDVWQAESGEDAVLGSRGTQGLVENERREE